MGLGIDGGLFRLVLLLHILCAIGGFGGVAFNGLYRVRARQRGGDAELVLLEENGYVSRIAEFLIYGVFVFGVLVVATSKSYWEFSQTWLSLSMLLYIIEIGVLHGLIHRSERQHAALLRQVDATGAGGHSPDVAQLDQLERRIRLGWGAFDIFFLLILYLMVFTPGHIRVG